MRHVPQAVPEPLFHDAEHGLFAMSFLDPAQHPVWKQQLMEGRINPNVAGALGALVGTIHAASAGDKAVAARFATDDNFHALRLEPYLLATAEKHPDIAPQLKARVERTANTRLALVHGDVSPKNVLVGPKSPVLLDAECAWYGDPAFDVAFCLNHLLLKCLVNPGLWNQYLAAFDSLAMQYLARVDWEPKEALEARAASLLPALLLARVDGKSPVEYLQTETDREAVRRVAKPLLTAPPSQLAAVASRWVTSLTAALA